mgnify:CR=1 FL=1
MNAIVNIFKTYYLEIILVSSVFSILSIILIIMNYARTTKIIKKYKRLMRGVNNNNLEAMLVSHIDNVEKALKQVDELKHSHNLLSKQVDLCVQNVGIVRYNAFDNIGSQQSYSVALLDANKNGVVLTGLFGRDMSSTYAKPIINGQSSYPLSGEEKQAISLSIKNNN